MKLFLCSHFSSVGSLIKEEIENKKVAFIPTASLREGYTGSALFLLNPKPVLLLLKQEPS